MVAEWLTSVIITRTLQLIVLSVGKFKSTDRYLELSLRRHERRL